MPPLLGYGVTYLLNQMYSLQRVLKTQLTAFACTYRQDISVAFTLTTATKQKKRVIQKLQS
jgi:hypothetical protein